MKGIIILAILACIATVSFAATDKIVCYYGSWAVYRPGNGKFDVEDINTDLCTHIIFTFLGLNNDGTIKILDPWNEIDKRAFERFANLKSRNPSIKVLIAIGGWNEGSSKYSTVVNNPTLRTKFVESIVKFVGKYRFDGFDLDWEYPGQRGGSSTDREAFVLLLQELRERFDQNGWLLTAAVSASIANLATSYNVPKLSRYLDLINIMTYDLHGSWEAKTGQNAPLYASKIDKTDQEKLLNVDSAISGWISAGANPEKLVLGMPTYARTFTLASSSNNALGAPTTGGGNPGPYTSQSGFMGYNEICEKFNTGGWTTVWDDEQKSTYAYNGNQWMGYDNVRSIKLKSKYAVNKKLGGVMIWSIETDDSKNICGDGKFPLLTAINSVLKGVSGTTTTEAVTSTRTTTTTKATTTTTPSSGSTTESGNSNQGICKNVGYTRDPINCDVFYYCQKNDNGFDEIKFKCPDGLYFDTVTISCNWPNEVEC